MEFCACGRQANARCTRCGTVVCGVHVELRADSAVCSTCREGEQAARLEASDRSIMERTGVKQVAAALDAGGLTIDGFKRFRSMGVAFETSSPWEEVKRLYREHPIRTGNGIQYSLTIKTALPVFGGSKQDTYTLPRIRARSIAIHNSEGYTVDSGLVMEDGTIVSGISRPSSRHVHLSERPYEGKLGEGIGPGLLETRRIVNRYRNDIELRIRQDHSVRFSDARASKFIEPMFGIWRSSARVLTK